VILIFENDLSVVVMKCKADETRNSLIEFYDFVKDVVGVKDLFFLIRDRVENDVILVFQISMEPTLEKAVESKIIYKLKKLLPENNYVIEPDINHSLYKYASPIMRKLGIDSKKSVVLNNLLSQLGRIAVDVIKTNCFDSEDRVEIVSAMSMMLGLTEYGLLSTKEMEVGYYDRIDNKYHTCLKESFGK
jgi:hypothetical protein